MTTSDEKTPAAESTQPEQATAQILELLDKLAAVEGFGDAAAATGMSEDRLRASLRQAAFIIRRNQESPVKKRWPLLGSILDWQEMTVAEALEILAEHASQQEQVLKKENDSPKKEGS